MRIFQMNGKVMLVRLIVFVNQHPKLKIFIIKIFTMKFLYKVRNFSISSTTTTNETLCLDVDAIRISMI